MKRVKVRVLALALAVVFLLPQLALASESETQAETAFVAGEVVLGEEGEALAPEEESTADPEAAPELSRSVAPLGVEIPESTQAQDAVYPWTPYEGTGDYFADRYEALQSGHVFEAVTQERLQDIFSSSGNYYILLGGPNIATTQKVIGLIDEQARADGITKIYVFNPYLDDYQADITDAATELRGGNASTSIYNLWLRLLTFLPAEAPVSDYDSSDTVLLLYNRNEANPGTAGTIRAYYRYTAADLAADTASSGFNAVAEKGEISQVFRGGGGAVIASDERTSLQFFNRVYNGGATRIEGSTPSANRIGAPVTLFDGLTEANFKFKQVTFGELQTIYNTPGEHVIFYGATWCHNTQAIIGTIAAQAASNENIDTIYVYDTTLGNQLAFGTGASIDTVTGTSSSFNSRNSANANGNYSYSYIYGEAVKPLGQFITENESYKSNSIAYYPNGDLSGTLTTNPFASNADNPAYDPDTQVRNAIRLQLPFLIAYDKSKETPVVRQWLHAQESVNSAGEPRYLEYMLELAWVRATELATASTNVYSNGAANEQGLTLVQAAAEAVVQVSYVLDVPEKQDSGGDTGDDNGGTDTGDDNGGDDAGDNGGNSGNNNSNDNSGSTTGSSGSGTGTVAESARTVTTYVTYYVPASSGSTAGTSSGSNTAADSATQTSTSAVAEPPVAEDLPDTSTPLVKSADLTDTDEADKPFTIPLWVGLAVAALALLAIVLILLKSGLFRRA
ncbi:MAG: hypothetical protein LBR14_03135 [Clostridiales Family XIII bacterium]|jgi:hypothetical protein|nr:hypothetical protein [Clostridiales Family XIII bacterium]